MARHSRAGWNDATHRYYNMPPVIKDRYIESLCRTVVTFDKALRREPVFIASNLLITSIEVIPEGESRYLAGEMVISSKSSSHRHIVTISRKRAPDKGCGRDEAVTMVTNVLIHAR